MYKELFEKIVYMFSTGDVSSASSVFSNSYIDHQKPEWIEEDGTEEFIKIVALARKSLPNLVVKIQDDIIAEGNKIVGRLLWVSDKGERETIEILRIMNGQVEEHWGAEAWEKTKQS